MGEWKQLVEANSQAMCGYEILLQGQVCLLHLLMKSLTVLA